MGAIWLHSAPGVDFGGFRASFGRSFSIPNLRNLVLFFDMFSGCFLEGFWSGFGVVLGDFLVPQR